MVLKFQKCHGKKGKKHKNVVHCQKFIKWYGNGFGIFHFPVSILFFVWDSPDYALTNGI